MIDKVAAVLGALTAGSQSLAELQQATGLPRATAHRLAVALEQHGYVRRDGAGRFHLGLGLIALGQAAAAAFPLSETARPSLERLRQLTGESVQLYVREGEARRCVVSLQSPHALRWIVPEGALLPLDRGSAGRVLSVAPAAPARRVDHPLTAGDEPGSGLLPGVVESVEEREPGVASVSAAVVDGAGRVVAALSVSGPIDRLGRSPSATCGAAVARAAAEVSERLTGTRVG